MDQAYYRTQADRCRRLARLLPGDEAAQRLLRLGDVYQAKAEALLLDDGCLDEAGRTAQQRVKA
jgi:hypothetical protein